MAESKEHQCNPSTKNIFIKYFPLFCLEIYLWTGFLMYVFGPWKFPYAKDIPTIIYVSAINIFIAAGYIIAMKKPSKNHEEGGSIRANKWLCRAIIISGAVVAVPYCMYRLGTPYPHIIEAISNLSLAYDRAAKASLSFIRSGLTLLFGFGYLFEYMLICIVYYFFNDLSKWMKTLGAFLCLWYLSIEVCTGHNKGVFVISFIVLVMYLTKLMQGAFKGKKTHLAMYTLASVIIVAIAPVYFGLGMTHRSDRSDLFANEFGEVQELQYEVNPDYGFVHPEIIDELPETVEASSEAVPTTPEKVVPGVVTQEMVDRFREADQNRRSSLDTNPLSYSYFDYSDPLYSLLPSQFQRVYILGTFYYYHGYHGLSIALRQPFDFCFGVGHSPFLQSLLERFTGIDMYPKTYIYKVNQAGYPINLFWGTAYVTFPSDFTFVGTVFLMGALGWLLGALWREMSHGGDLVSIVLLTSLVYNFLMIPSYWQASCTGSDFVVFYGSLLLWIVLRIKRRVMESATHMSAPQT